MENMEKMTYMGNQKKIEVFLLVMYTIYTAGIIISAGRPSLENWIDISLIAALVSSWFLYFCKFKNYQFRATYTSVMMQISLILYTFYERELRYALPVFIVFVVMVGLYGIAENIFLTLITTIIVFFYHIFIIQTIPLHTARDIVSLIQRITNVWFVEFLVFVWTKRNYEGSKQLLNMIEELEKAENSKDDFVANVSHEIRTPINTICGMSEVVLSEELSLTVKEKVQDIQRAGRNLMGIVSDILDFSELQSGEIEIEEEAYNISSTINDVIHMAMAYKNDKKIELIIDCDPNIPCELLGDEKKLRRIILKLLSNAIKFTETGCVTLSIGCRKETYGINLSVTIKDTGIGIKEENLEKLFTTFNQVDASRKRQEGGLGLGMAISHALIQKMGGTITVKSKWGKGTAVRVVVPQKVLDEKPIVSLQNKSNINVAVYVDMEQFEMVEIRDEYSNMILNMTEKLKGKCQVCRNFSELQRRKEKEDFSHIFTSIVEYRENKGFFDELAKETNVVIVLEPKDEKEIINPQLLKIYKPFYILAIVSVLNGEKKEEKQLNFVSQTKIETKDAHVLIVDDNSMNIRVAEEMLAAYKIKVTKAVSGEEALEKITSMNYDFVFMDHMMPEMDGVECFHRIRQKSGSYYRNVPIIALTANAVAGNREMLLKEGFNDFLEKPIERSVLERVLKRNLPQDKIVEKSMVQEMTEEVFVKKEEKPLEKTESSRGWLDILESFGLDVKMALVYCNGEDAYYKILQGYCEEGEKLGNQIADFYRKQDWKNYTIVVHGIKSAMRSIGAVDLSELAKKLEMAGKKEEISYILEHHEEMMVVYKELFKKLRDSGIFGETPKAEVKQEKTEIAKEPLRVPDAEIRELGDEDFDSVLEKMEESIYELNSQYMLEITEQLKRCSYRGVSLQEIMAAAQRKIEMSDYLSAVDMIEEWKSKNQK